MIRLIVAGSRSLGNEHFPKCLRYLYWATANLDRSQIEVISGGASGGDSVGETFARQQGREPKRFLASWKDYGRAAGPLRNAEMARYAAEAIVAGGRGLLIALWDGKSRGTEGMIELAREHGLEVRIYRYLVEPDKQEGPGNTPGPTNPVHRPTADVVDV